MAQTKHLMNFADSHPWNMVRTDKLKDRSHRGKRFALDPFLSLEVP